MPFSCSSWDSSRVLLPVVSMETGFYFSLFTETEFSLLCVQCAYYVLPSLPLMVHTLSARLIECVWQPKLYQRIVFSPSFLPSSFPPSSFPSLPPFSLSLPLSLPPSLFVVCLCNSPGCPAIHEDSFLNVIMLIYSDY